MRVNKKTIANKKINEEKQEDEKEETVQSEEEDYKVEAIVSVRKNKSGYEALIKWEGYKDSDNTWENLDNLRKDWGLERNRSLFIS